MTTPIFIGEQNPHSSRASMALFDHPSGATGDRLRRMVLGVSAARYVGWTKYDLCDGLWALRDARLAAASIEARHPGETLVLLGAKVAEAFGFARWVPFGAFVPTRAHRSDHPGAVARYILLPHPSARNLEFWGDRTRGDSVAHCRRELAHAFPTIPWGEADGGPATTKMEARGFARELMRRQIPRMEAVS